MKKVIAYVIIALHFEKMLPLDLLKFAKGIRDKIATETAVTISATIQDKLKQLIIDLDALMVLRLTDLSKSLTKKEGILVNNLMLILAKIAGIVEQDANELTPGDIAAVKVIIYRIGFMTKEDAALEGRTFQIYKVIAGGVSIRVKALLPRTTYYWRWSSDKINWVELQTSQVAAVRIKGLPNKKEAFFQSATTPPQSRVPELDAEGLVLEWGEIISQYIP